MNKKHLLLAILLSLTTITAEATLLKGTSNGQSIVYSSISDITWTGDANLLGTMISNQGFDTVINSIITTNPVINSFPNDFDTPAYSGEYILSSSDFSRTHLGRMTWFGAKAYVSYLNSINFAGSNKWALPDIGSIGDSHYPNGQLDQLFYDELHGIQGYPIPNTNNFSNEQSYQYWYSSINDRINDYGPSAYFYVTDGGFLTEDDGLRHEFFAWAYSPGNFAAVIPIPGAVWLMCTGLFVLLGLRQSGKAV
jgi:hypothetical protein